MYLGKIVELGKSTALIGHPVHPYTRLLLESAPDLMRDTVQRPPLRGEAANAIAPPVGCRFAPRCPFVLDLCRRRDPPLLLADSGREVACHRAVELLPASTQASASEQRKEQ
jgi:oligopeptide/dipeptide ABC transporter ATP-binding protein